MIDLLPTTLAFTGIKAPENIRGIKQAAVQGTSLVYSIDNAKALSKHTTQYYYIFGSRSICSNGWKAVYAFKPAVTNGLVNSFSVSGQGTDGWELFNLDEDFNERIDLSKKEPAKLAKLKTLFEVQARQYKIYPFVTWDDVIQKISQRPKVGN